MKFTIADRFTLTINDQEIKGQYKKLTKKQESEIQKKFKKEMDLSEEMQGIARSLRRLELENKVKGEEDNSKLLEYSDRLEEINETLKKSDFKEKISKYRFGLSIDSEQLEELITLGEDYGYSLVLEMIVEAIAEDKAESKKN